MSILFGTSSPQLPIPDDIQRDTWQNSQGRGGPGAPLQRYLNQVAVTTLLPWIAEASGQTPTVAQGTAARWGIVGGSAIQVGNVRLIVVPSEAMDREEFAVPQEWVDAPNWIGDYYLAVEVDTDGQWVEPWGYATHAMLKTQGTSDPIARTYNLEGDRVISDLSILWVMMQFSEPTRVEVPAPMSITLDQAQDWIQQLSSVSLPRWELPPSQWNALINNDRLFQQLCAARQAEVAASTPSPLNLSAWLQGAIATGWTTLDGLFQGEPNWAASLRNSPAQDAAGNAHQYAKSMSLGDGLPAVVLAVTVRDEPGDRRSILIQVLPSVGESYLPEALRLAMYSTSGDEVQSVTAEAQTRLVQLRPFRCAPGTAFQVQVTWEATTATEFFTA